MSLVVTSATEFVVKLPHRSRTLEQLLEAASVVGGDVLASCMRREGDSDLFLITVGDEELYAPHFRSTYRRAVDQRPVIIISGQMPEDLDDELLARLPEAGISLLHTYSSVREGIHFNQALHTSDHERGLEVLRSESVPGEEA